MNNKYSFYEAQKKFIEYIKAYYDQFEYIYKGLSDAKLLHLMSDQFYVTSQGTVKIAYLHKFQISLEQAMNQGYALLDSLPIAFIEEYK